jgi:hypothetical protein
LAPQNEKLLYPEDIPEEETKDEFEQSSSSKTKQGSMAVSDDPPLVPPQASERVMTQLYELELCGYDDEEEVVDEMPVN